MEFFINIFKALLNSILFVLAIVVNAIELVVLGVAGLFMVVGTAFRCVFRLFRNLFSRYNVLTVIRGEDSFK